VAVRREPLGMAAAGPRRPIVEPPAAGTARVVVTLEPEDEGSAEVEEPVQSLDLPPWGDSSRQARFRVRPPAPAAEPRSIPRRI
jgi:hypothetical protein